jgi:lysozyme
VKTLRSGDAEAAEAALKAWNKAGGRIYKGLVRRRAEEADLIFRGAYPIAIEADATRAAASSPQEIVAVRSALAALGDLAGSADGSDGPETTAALVAFQRDNDLVADGIPGPATRATLDRRLGEKRARTATAAAGAGGAAAGGSVSAATDGGLPLETLLWIGGGALAAAIAVALLSFAWRRRGALLTTFQSTIARLT